MSFTIPPIQSTDISTQVWSDKEIIDSSKLFIENYAKTTGILINTPYTALDLTDVERIITIMVYADNTDETDRQHTMTLTIDGEAFVFGPGTDIDDGDTVFLVLDSSSVAAGTNPPIIFLTSQSAFGLQTANSQGDSTQALQTFGGQSVTLVWEIDETPGTNQMFKCDCIYLKKALT